MKYLLIVKTGLGLGGIERSLVEFLRGLDYERYQVDLLLLYGPFNLLAEIHHRVHVINAEQVAPKIRLHPLYAINYVLSQFCGALGLKRGARFFKKRKLDFYYRKLYLRHCRKKYDVGVAYQQSFACEYLARFVAADKKIMMYHHGEIEDRDYLEPWFRRTDLLLTVGKRIAEKLKQAFPFLREKIVWFPNYIDGDAVRKKSLEYTPDFSPECLNLCTCGRIAPEKGFDIAVEAAAILRDRGVRFHWYFVGGGYQDAKKPILAAIRQRHLESCITITGFVNNPYPYLRGCDILVVPSRFEANPLILYEGKILARRIIATRTDGALELLTPGVDALLTGFSAQEIADGIEYVMQDKSLLPASGKPTEDEEQAMRREYYRQWDQILSC